MQIAFHLIMTGVKMIQQLADFPTNLMLVAKWERICLVKLMPRLEDFLQTSGKMSEKKLRFKQN